MSYAIDRAKEPTNPGHYRLSKVELIDLIEVLSFNVGNAVKYLVRAGRKSESPVVEDLKKAIWYAERELYRLTGKKPVADELREHVDLLKAGLAARDGELADYERTVAGLREQLRAEEERRAGYQAVDGAARRFVAEKRRVDASGASAPEFGRRMSEEFKLLAAVVEAGKIES